ncbi:MAG: hypothetical protein V1806_12015 [Pseudomonadota bacterium]
MDANPLWTRCLHLSAGTCPQILMESGLLSGQDTPRPELTQDLALERLALACLACHLAPTETPRT